MAAGGYIPHMVELYDGRFAKSDSEAWRQECYWRDWLRTAPHLREARLGDSVKIKGLAGIERLRKELLVVEPFFVLSLPTKLERIAYLESTERAYGWQAKKTLEEKVRKIWSDRRAALDATAAQIKTQEEQ